MASCPNCGRQTARTKDWCCQWCGYPLFSGSFKMLDKTYKELKAERLGQETAKEEETVEQVQVHPEETTAADSVNDTPETQPEIPADPEPETETVEPETVTRVVRRVRKISRPPERPVRRIIRRRRPVSDSEEIEEIVEYIDEVPEREEIEYYEDDSESEEEYEESLEDDAEYDDDEYEEVEPEPEPRRIVRRPEPRKTEVRKPVSEPVMEEPEEIEEPDEPEEDDLEEAYKDNYLDSDDTGDEPVDDDDDDDDDDDGEYEEYEEEVVVAAPEVMKPAMVITVEDIVSAYETEGDSADARFANKVLQVTGIIQKVEVKEAMSVYALVLEAEETYELRQTVRCVFDREHGSVLSRFVPAQKVTVLGKYDGSIINISMRDCSLVGEPE